MPGPHLLWKRLHGRLGARGLHRGAAGLGRAGGGGGAEFRTPSGGRGAAQAPPVAFQASHLYTRRHPVEAGRRAGRCNQPASYVLLLHGPGAAQALDAPAPLCADLGSARERLEAAGRGAGARHEGRARGCSRNRVCPPPFELPHGLPIGGLRLAIRQPCPAPGTLVRSPPCLHGHPTTRAHAGEPGQPWGSLPRCNSGSRRAHRRAAPPTPTPLPAAGPAAARPAAQAGCA